MLNEKSQNFKIFFGFGFLLMLGVGCPFARQPVTESVNQPMGPAVKIQPEVIIPLESAETITPGFTTQIIKPLKSPDGNFTLRTAEGLELTLTPAGQVKKLTVNKLDLVLEKPQPIFYALDAVTGLEQALTGKITIENDHLAFLSSVRNNLQLRVKLQSVTDHITVLGRIRGVTNEDRVVTFSFRLPFDFVGGTWWEDFQVGQAIKKDQTYFNETAVNPVLKYDLKVSNSPISTVTKGAIGLTLAVPMSKPRPARLIYSSDKGYRVEYDFGLAQETQAVNFVPANSADFEVVLLDADPKYGLREGLGRYAQIYHQDFRSFLEPEKFGTEGPGLEYLSGRNITDFAMAWYLAEQESNDISRARRAGMRVARGVIPTELWVGGSFKEDTVLTPEEAKNFLNDRKNSNEIDPQSGQPYKEVLAPLTNSLMRDAQGQERLFDYEGNPTIAKFDCCPPALLVSVSGDPDLGQPNLGKIVWDEVEEVIKDSNYSTVYNDNCDLSTYEDINPFDYNREHFKYVTAPLTFEASVKKPATLLPLSYAKFLQIERLALRGIKTATCNFHDAKMVWWFAPYVDEFTSELMGPFDSKFFRLMRLTGFRKPIALAIDAPPLAENSTIGLDYELLFKKAALYGILIGAGHESAGQINKFRLQAVKYLPLARKLHQLGWEPVTLADAFVGAEKDFDILVERFGSRPRGVAFSVFNDSAKEKVVTLFLDLRRLGLTGEERVTELVNKLGFESSLVGKSGIIESRELKFKLPANSLAIFEIR